MFQFRTRGSGHRMFAYERDLLNLFRWICKGAGERLHPAALPDPVKLIAEHTGMTNRDLCEAFAALARMINSANNTTPLYDTFAASWVSSGMDKVKPAALVAMFFQIGVGTLDYYYQFIREAIAQGRTVPDSQEMSEIIERLSHSLRTDDPAAQRRLRLEAMNSKEAILGDYPDPLRKPE